MAEESLRDLVVTVALRSDDFSRNIKMLQAQMKQIDQTFKASGNGIKDYEKSYSGMGAHISSLTQMLAKQNQVVDQARQKQEKSYDLMIKAAHRYKAELEKLSRMSKDDSGYAKQAELTELQRKSYINNETKYANAATQYANAQSKAAELRNEIERLNSAVSGGAGNGWTDYAERIKRSGDSLKQLSADANLVKSSFDLFMSSAQSLDAFSSGAEIASQKIQTLTERLHIAENTVQEYGSLLSDLRGELANAITSRNEEKIAALNIQIAEETARMNEAQASVNAFSEEIRMLGTGWDQFEARINANGESIRQFAANANLAQSEFELFMSNAQSMDPVSSGAEIAAQKIQMLTQQMYAAEMSAQAYSERIADLGSQLAIASESGNAEKILSLNIQITEETAKMNAAQAAANGFAQEIRTLESGWTGLEDKLKASGEYISQFAANANLAQSEFNLFMSSAQSMDPVSSGAEIAAQKIQMLTQQMYAAEMSAQTYSERIADLGSKLAIAAESGNADKIASINLQITEETAKMNAAQAAANGFAQEIKTLESGWTLLDDKLKASGEYISQFAANANLAQSEFNLFMSSAQSMDPMTAGIDIAIQKIEMLTQQMYAAEMSAQTYEERIADLGSKLAVATESGNSDKIASLNIQIAEETAKMNDAKASANALAQEIKTLDSGWSLLENSLKSSGDSIKQFAANASLAQSKFDLFMSNSGNIDPLSSGAEIAAQKIQLLTERMNAANSTASAYAERIKDLGSQLEIATKNGDTDKIASLNLQITEETANMNAARAAANGFAQEIKTLESGWTQLDDKLKSSDESIKQFAANANLAQSEFNLFMSSAQSMDPMTAGLDISIQKIEMLTAQMKAAESTAQAYSERIADLGKKLEVATESGNADKISSLNTQIAEETAKMNDAKASANALAQEIKTLDDGWELLENSLKASDESIKQFAADASLAQSKFDLFMSGMQSLDPLSNGAEISAQRILMLNEQMKSAEATASAYSDRIRDLGSQLAIATGNGETDKVASLNLQISEETARMNEARASANALAQEIRTLESGSAQLDARLEASGASLQQFSANASLAQSQFDLFMSAGAAMDTLKNGAEISAQKIVMLTEQMNASQSAAQTYSERISDLGVKLLEATLNSDTAKISELTAQIAQETANMNAAQASANGLAREIEMLGNGWMLLDERLKESDSNLEMFGNEAQLAAAKFELMANATGNADRFKESMKGITEQAKSLREQADAVARSIQEYNNKISALTQQKNIALSIGDAGKVRELNSEISKTEVLLANARVEEQKLRNEADALTDAWKLLGNAISTLGTGLSGIGSGMTSLGMTMNRYVSRYAKQGIGYVRTYSNEFETSMSTVRKAFMGAAEEEFSAMESYAKTTAEQMGIAQSEILDTVAMVGQMGIPTESYEQFTDVVLKLGMTTDMATTDIAKNMAQYFNIAGRDLKDMEQYEKYGSTVEYLGVNMQTTESDIIEMAKAIAAAGAQVGMTDAEILAMASTLSSLGVAANKGGTAFSKALINIESSVANLSSEDEKTKEAALEALTDYARVSGMTVEQFTEKWKNSSTDAFMSFISGVAKLDEKDGISAIATLNDLGLSEVRLRDTLLRTVNANKLMSDSVQMANKAWGENNALTEATNELLDTTATKEEQLKAKAVNFALTLGDDMRPAYEKLLETVSSYIDGLSDLDSAQRKQIITYGLVAAAAGPVLTIMGRMLSSVGGMVTGIGSFVGALGSKGLLGALTATTGGTGLLVIGIAALAAGIAYGVYKLNEYRNSLNEVRVAQEKLNKTAKEWEDNDVLTGFESGKGLGAFHIESSLTFDVEFSDSPEEEAKKEAQKTGNAWLDSLIEVWTDGKKETDEILNEWVTNSGVGSMYETLLGSGTASEEDLNTLKELEGSIEGILKKRQNGYLTQEDIDNLNKYYKQAQEIAKNYGISFSFDGGGDYGALGDLYAEIETNVRSAIERGSNPQETFENAFSALTDGLGQYTDQLDAEFDKQYAAIMGDSSLTVEEKDKKVQALKEWYNQKGKEAGEAYVQSLKEAMQNTGVSFQNSENDPDNPYANTVDKLERVKEILADFESGKGNDGLKGELANILGDLDESEFLEIETALVAMNGAAENAGVDLAEVDSTAASLLDTLGQLKQLANGEFTNTFGEDIANSLKQMFGTGNDEEVLQIAAKLNIDGLEASYKAWAEGSEHAPIIPVVDTNKIDVSSVSIDLGTGTISLSSDAEGRVTMTNGVSVDIGENGVVLNTAEGTVQASTWNFTGVGEKGIKVNARDTKTGLMQNLTIDSIDFEVENGRITGIKSINGMENLDLSNMTDADGNPIGVMELAMTVLGTLYGKNITYNDDGTKITVGINAEIEEVVLANGVKLPELTYDPMEWNEESLDLFSHKETTGQLFGYDINEGRGLQTLLQRYLYFRQGELPFSFFTKGMTASFGREVQAFMNEQFTGADGETYGFDEMLSRVVIKGFKNFGQLSGEQQEQLNSFVLDMMQFINPEGVAFDTETGAKFREMWFKALFGSDSEYTDTEENRQKISNILTEMFNGTFSFEGFSEETKTGIGDAIKKGISEIVQSAMTTDGSEGTGTVNPLQSILNGFINNGEGLQIPEIGGTIAKGFAVSVAAALIKAGSDTSIGSAISMLKTSIFNKISKQDGQGSIGDFGIGAMVASAIQSVHPTENIDLSGVKTAGAESIGANLSLGVAKGIRSKIGVVRSAAQEVIDIAKKAMQVAADIHSPSRLFRDSVGVNITKGVVQGIREEANRSEIAVGNAMRYMAEQSAAMVPAYSGSVSSTTNNYNDYSSVSVPGTFVVRSESDITKIAREIVKMQKNNRFGKGMR